MHDNLIFLLCTAISYYIYCGGALKIGYTVLTPRSVNRLSSTIVFPINFSVLCLVAALELELIANWILFLIILSIEFLILFPSDKLGAFFLTLLCILCGMAVNLLLRAAFSLVLRIPLASFSPFDFLRVSSAVIGFILTGLWLRWLSGSRYAASLVRILRLRRHLPFLLWIMVVLFVSLTLHLLLYLRLDYSPLPKLWSLASCLFALLGLYWSLSYAARLSYLDHLHLQNTTLQKALAFRQVQEAQLAAASNQDALTGLPNRRAAQQTLTHWLEQDTPFALCLIDLDGLKQVNDVQGHNQGDQYILTVSGLLQHACRKDEDALFRFGGDEFILLFHNMTRNFARQRLESISEALSQTEANMPMAFSYGIALRQPNDTLDTIIQRADAQMYDMKHAHKSRQSRDLKEEVRVNKE